MIVKHFDRGWIGVLSADYQHTTIQQYLNQFFNDDSRTILINTTWINISETKSVDEYSADQYRIFVGDDWPPLEEILNDDRFISKEISDFKSLIDGFRSRVESTYDHVLDYIFKNRHAIDNIIVYSLVDPGINIGLPKKFNIIKIGYFPDSQHWIDFHALLVNKYFYVDSRLSTDSNTIDIAFMCLNGKPHQHRGDLVQSLLDLNLQDRGLISFGGDALRKIPKLSIPETHDIKRGINFDPYDAMTLGDINNWNRHFLNIVTETVSDVVAENFWSEKIFKPIVGLRPFLVYSPDGAVPILERHGFLHYCDDFSDISDLDLRQHVNIPKFLKTLSDQPNSYFKSKYQQLAEKISYNKNRFDQYVLEQIDNIEKGLTIN
jgi:hypothetical protein